MKTFNSTLVSPSLLFLLLSVQTPRADVAFDTLFLTRQPAPGTPADVPTVPDMSDAATQ